MSSLTFPELYKLRTGRNKFYEINSPDYDNDEKSVRNTPDDLTDAELRNVQKFAEKNDLSFEEGAA